MPSWAIIADRVVTFGWQSCKGRLRSLDVTNISSSITNKQENVQTWPLSHCICLVTWRWFVSILTHLGQFGLPCDHDPRLNFQTVLLRSPSIYFGASWRKRWYFRYFLLPLISKMLFVKKNRLKTTILICWLLEAKPSALLNLRGTSLGYLYII